MPTIDATVGGSSSNSYETLTEANVYFDERLPLPTPWVVSGDASIRALIMATRVLDSMSVPRKTLKRDGCNCNFYITARQWTGYPASATQRLAWPRIGMFGRNGRPLDFLISDISVASPTIVTTTAAHGLTTGDKVAVVDSNSTPSIDGERAVTVLSSTTFSVPVAVTVAGTTGRIAVIPEELKEAESELAGQLMLQDTTLDNAVKVQGLTSIRAGSVSLSFKEAIDAHVLPDAVMNLMPPGWFTDELIVPALGAEFELL